MKNLSYIFICLSLISCSTLNQRNKERKLQTEILNNIKEKEDNFSQCAKKEDIFKHFKSERVRVELIVTLNYQGQIETFKTDNKRYPDSFMECIFNILDNTQFPKLNEGEAVQFTQPFIFRNN